MVPASQLIARPVVTRRSSTERWPWPHQVGPAVVQIWGDVSALDVGTILATIASYNSLEEGGDAREVLARLVAQGRDDAHFAERGSQLVSGGIELIAAGSTLVSPGCCCGVEYWRDWLDPGVEGFHPWCGHDPDGFFEHRPGGVMAIGYTAEDAVEVELAGLQRAVLAIEPALRGFLPALRRWCGEVAPELSDGVVGVVEGVFALRPPAPQASDEDDG